MVKGFHIKVPSEKEPVYEFSFQKISKHERLKNGLYVKIEKVPETDVFNRLDTMVPVQSFPSNVQSCKHFINHNLIRKPFEELVPFTLISVPSKKALRLTSL